VISLPAFRNLALGVLVLVYVGSSVAAQSAHAQAATESYELAVAVTSRDVEAVRALLAGHEIGLESTCDGSKTALRYAAELPGAEPLIRFLTLAGANTEARDSAQDLTPLGAAIYWEQIDNVRALLDAGASVSAKDKHGNATLLLATLPTLRSHEAPRRANPIIVESLLNHGSDPSASNDVGFTPFRVALEDGRFDLVAMMRRRRPELTVSGTAGAFGYARAGSLAQFKRLFNPEIGLRAVDHKGCTMLHAACETGNTPVVTFLASKAANLMAMDPEGQTPLIVAANFNRAKAITALCRAGVDVNQKDAFGETALQIAAGWQYYASCRALLNCGARIESRGPDGLTPLTYAVGKRTSYSDRTDWGVDNVALARLFVVAGANVGFATEDGTTALECAKYTYKVKIVKYLEGILSKGHK